VRYKHQPGLPFLPDAHGGVLLPQVYAWDFKSDKVKFSDDLLFDSHKKALFQLLLLPESAKEAQHLLATIEKFPRHKFLDSGDATILIQNYNVQSTQIQVLLGKKVSVARVATGDEFAADPVLCRNRPAPKYYDPLRISKELGNMKFVMVRPDRFVYAAVRTGDELVQALSTLTETLLPRRNDKQCMNEN
jgi:hypothetical protein